MVLAQPVPLAQPTMARFAVHAIPVIVYQVAPVFRINVPALMGQVQQGPPVQLTMAQFAVHATQVTVC